MALQYHSSKINRISGSRNYFDVGNYISKNSWVTEYLIVPNKKKSPKKTIQYGTKNSKIQLLQIWGSPSVPCQIHAYKIIELTSYRRVSPILRITTCFSRRRKKIESKVVRIHQKTDDLSCSQGGSDPSPIMTRGLPYKSHQERRRYHQRSLWLGTIFGTHHWDRSSQGCFELFIKIGFTNRELETDAKKKVSSSSSKWGWPA